MLTAHACPEDFFEFADGMLCDQSPGESIGFQHSMPTRADSTEDERAASVICRCLFIQTVPERNHTNRETRRFPRPAL